MTTDSLRARLDAAIAGQAPGAVDVPTDECFELSEAIAACGRASLSAERLPAPSHLLPPLP